MTGLDLRLPPHLANLHHGEPVIVHAESTLPGDLILNDPGGHAGGWWGFVDSVADYRRGREYRFNHDNPYEPVVLHDANLVRITVHAEYEHGTKPNGAMPGRVRVHTCQPADRVTIRKLQRPGAL